MITLKMKPSKQESEQANPYYETYFSALHSSQGTPPIEHILQFAIFFQHFLLELTLNPFYRIINFII